MTTRFVCHTLGVAVLLGLAAGCQKPDSSASAAVKESPGAPPTPVTPLGGTPAGEDPEVVAHAKKKGWHLFQDMRIADGKRLVFLSVENRDKPFEDVTLAADDYKMIAKATTVQMLDLRKVKNTQEGLQSVAGMGQLEGIIVGGDATDAGMKALAKCPSLEFVTLSAKPVTDDGIKELAALPKLKALYLMGMTITGSGFAAFAGSKTLEAVGLEFVDGFTDDGARNLAKLPNLKDLKIGASFGESKLTAAGIKAIVDAHLPAKFEFDKKLIDDALLEALVAKGWLYGPSPPGGREKKPAKAEEVQVIVLSGSKVTDKGMRSLLNCTNVTSMHLDRTGITDETLKELSAFAKLNYLALEQTKVTAAGLEAIARLPIRHLAMQGCELSEESFKAFGKMTALEELWLSRAKMKADWLRHIAALPKLKDLNLLQADFDDAAAKHLSGLSSLESLTVNDTQLGDKGFLELLALPKLRSFYVDGTKVSKEVYQKAKKDHPKMTLYFYRYDR
jgi:hypothetical protein